MKESDYILASNRAYLSSALASLRECLFTGDPVAKTKLGEAYARISELLDQTHEKITTEEDGNEGGIVMTPGEVRWLEAAIQKTRGKCGCGACVAERAEAIRERNEKGKIHMSDFVSDDLEKRKRLDDELRKIHSEPRAAVWGGRTIKPNGERKEL